jgi:hypothetical protein
MARKFVRIQSVDAKEIERAAIERGIAAGRENPEDIDMAQAQAVDEISPDLMRTQPHDQFDMEDPDDYPVWQNASGFVENLDDPMRTIKQESLPANLIKWLTGKTGEALQAERKKYRLDPNVAAINTELGVLEDADKIDTPEYAALMSELEAVEADLESADEDPKFSFATVKQAFNRDPGAFFAEFANTVAKAPELLTTPIGWRIAATRTGAALTRMGITTKAVATGEVAAGAAGTAAAGAAVTGAISAGEQLGEAGEITDPEAVALDAELGAAASVLLVGAFKGIGAAAKAVTGAKPVTKVPKFETEPVEPLVGPVRTLHARGSDALAKEIEVLERVVADDIAAAEHGARISAHQQVELGLDVAKRIEQEAGFRQIKELARAQKFVDHRPFDTPMQKAFKDALWTRRHAGKADPKVLATTAFIGLGAVVGAGGADDPLLGAAVGVGATVGMILAGRTLRVLGKGVINSYKFVTKPDNRIRIDDLTNMHEADNSTHYRSTWQYKEAVKVDVPKPKQREAIAHWLEGDKTQKLSASEQITAKQIRGMFDEVARVAEKEGVLESYLDNYVPHFWRQKGQSKSEIMQILSDQLGATGGMGTKTVHARQRVIPTLKAGIDAGLEPVTLDIAEIFKMYSDSVYRAIRNKQLAQALRKEIAPDGNPLVMRSGSRPLTAKEGSAAARNIAIAQAKLKRIEARVAAGKTGNLEKAREGVRRAEQSAQPAPQGYVSLNHPQFSGEKVHPDIAPSLNFIYHSTDPNVIMRGVLALNFAMKRSLVSMSFFHANALMESMVYAGVSPHKIVPALHQLAHGKAGDMVDEALRAGLKIGVIEDVGSDVFYAALKDIQSIADDILPVVGGAAVKGVEKLNRVVDDIMWDKIATGGKLAVFANEMEKALLNNAAKHAKDPKKFPLIPREQLAAEVAEYTNDAFGGLNWRRIAEGTKSKLGRDIAMAAFNPNARKWLQLGLFAPDWTIANVRVLLKAIPGVAKNKRITRMHQYYAARGALFFATAGSAINILYTGKPIWENEDPTMVDMGDGRRMTFSKQFVEPFHWVDSPGKTFINKGGILPKTAIELAKGIEYFSGRSSDPPLYADDATFWEKSYANAGLVGKKFVPIFAQQVADQGVSGMAGFLGHPIYGEKLE